jgi:hypothetical protein
MRSVAEVTKDIEEVQNKEEALYAKRKECLEASWKEPLGRAWQSLFASSDVPELKAQFESAYSWEQVNGQPTAKVTLNVEWASVEVLVSDESSKISRLTTSGVGYSNLTPEKLAEASFNHHVADVLIEFAQKEDIRGIAMGFLKTLTEDPYMLALIQESKLNSILHEALNTELKAIKEAELAKKYSEAAKVGNLIFKGMSAHLVSRVTNKCVFLIPITMYTKDSKVPVVENLTAKDLATLRSLADSNSSGRKEYSEESKIDTAWVCDTKRFKTYEFSCLIANATIVQA